MKFQIGFMLFLLVAFASGIAAQEKAQREDGDQPEEQAEKKQQVEEFADRFDKQFQKREPKVGMLIDYATAFDESGEPFDFEQTQGKFTVVVFGCNT